jgi:hypothetical protein
MASRVFHVQPPTDHWEHTSPPPSARAGAGRSPAFYVRNGWVNRRTTFCASRRTGKDADPPLTMANGPPYQLSRKLPRSGRSREGGIHRRGEATPCPYGRRSRPAACSPRATGRASGNLFGRGRPPHARGRRGRRFSSPWLGRRPMPTRNDGARRGRS